MKLPQDLFAGSVKLWGVILIGQPENRSVINFELLLGGCESSCCSVCSDHRSISSFLVSAIHPSSVEGICEKHTEANTGEHNIRFVVKGGPPPVISYFPSPLRYYVYATTKNAVSIHLSYSLLPNGTTYLGR